MSHKESGLKGVFSDLLSLTRFRNWIPILQENLVAALMLILVLPFAKLNITYVLFYTVAVSLFLTYSFVVNDVGDKEADIKEGKYKPIHSFSNAKIILTLVLLAFFTLAIPIFSGNLLATVGFIIGIALANLYSLKPTRFKERGILAIIVANFGMRSIPFIFFWLFLSPSIFFVLFFTGWLFMIGFQDELGHQLADFKNDEKTGTRTWVRHVGGDFGQKLLSVFVVGSFVYLLLLFFVLDFSTALAIAISLIMLRFVGDYGKGVQFKKMLGKPE
jgi:4-hydroxybenzoate polyprenyltransferase